MPGVGQKCPEMEGERTGAAALRRRQSWINALLPFQDVLK